MFSRMSTLVRPALRRHGAQAPTNKPPDTEQLIQQTAAGMAYYLGLSDEDATLRAQAACERRQRRHGGQPFSDGPVAPRDQAIKHIQAALNKNGSCLMALPFSGAALELLHEIASEGSLPLILIESQALAKLSGILGTTIADLPRCQTHEVIKHVKIQVAQPQAVVYVSFPELHTLTAGTTASTSFLGKACRFSVLDPLLCRYGIKTLLTIGYFPATASVGPELVSCDAPAIGPEGNSQAMTTLLRWLLGHLQVSASVAPDDTLSWHHLYRASAHCYQIERHNRIEQLEAYFKAWKRSPGGMPEALSRIAAARVAALRHAS